MLYLQLQQLAEELAAGKPHLQVIAGGRAAIAMRWTPAEHPVH